MIKPTNFICGENMKVKYQGNLPTQNNQTDAGYDLRAAHDETVAPFQWKLIKTGFSMKMPEGYCADVRSRSGMSYKSGVFVMNSPGTIDCNYTGDVGVILFNAGEEDFIVEKGDRIAQLVFIKVEHPTFSNEALEETDRGDKGFGSSGLK